jgi:glutamate synthase domain-containing protein 3
MTMECVTIDAAGMHYTPLNKQIRAAVAAGAKRIVLEHVLGQRFIADGLRGDDVVIEINGVPGGDLAMFMSGPTVIVHGNCEHAPGNTMDSGTIVVHGSAGDAVAHSMRGGTIFVRGHIGYRGGIHMKQYKEKCPTLVIGEYSRAFLGEYMAGGTVLVLGLHGGVPVEERGLGSGIHGGEIIIRGDVDDQYLGVGATKTVLKEQDRERIVPLIRQFAAHFGVDAEPLLSAAYTRVIPASGRPFAGKYTNE